MINSLMFAFVGKANVCGALVENEVNLPTILFN